MENYIPNLDVKFCPFQNVTEIDKEVINVLSVATKIAESALKVLWLSMPWWLQNTLWCLRGFCYTEHSISPTGFSSAECVMDSERRSSVKFIQDLRKNAIFKNNLKKIRFVPKYLILLFQMQSDQPESNQFFHNVADNFPPNQEALLSIQWIDSFRVN